MGQRRREATKSNMVQAQKEETHNAHDEHDDMMQCKNAMRKATSKNKSHDEQRKTWKASGAPVLGRYNTPPLREDLVPRSRMAPEGKTEQKEKR